MNIFSIPREKLLGNHGVQIDFRKAKFYVKIFYTIVKKNKAWLFSPCEKISL